LSLPTVVLQLLSKIIGRIETDDHDVVVVVVVVDDDDDVT